MRAWIRRVAPLAAVVAVAAGGAAAQGASARGPLSGTWSGTIVGSAGSGVRPVHIRIVVNSAETRGSWRISATCRGPLTLDSISGGYHHYLRHLARGATCAGGDIDCLRRDGASVYDSVTSHEGGEYDSAGTLRRISA
jgi:hypothetical protein